jgi:hypothetical protein
MDYTLVIGLLVVLVVGFFAYQWIMKRPAMPKNPKNLPPVLLAQPPAAEAAKEAPAEQQQQQQQAPSFPNIPGQTRAEATNPEPLQRREPSSQQAPALSSGEAPAQFDQHLRHPEQLFHQPTGLTATPTMQINDVPSGRASPQQGAAQGQQGFSPQMAQNGGAFVGNSMFAFDGMEPTGMTAF